LSREEVPPTLLADQQAQLQAGDLYEDRDRYGRYVACFQCGHYLSPAEEVALKVSAGDEVILDRIAFGGVKELEELNQ
jgi:hypothetical protein